ncbi:MAG TPA: hypothetical protein VK681_39245 [Reyranella sp.]|nr:hypothetical protein [Reyranella sp.]
MDDDTGAIFIIEWHDSTASATPAVRIMPLDPIHPQEVLVIIDIRVFRADL